jgi:hypothetical protein
MTAGPKVRLKFHIASGRAGHKVIEAGESKSLPPPSRIPRISRLMALALRFERLIRDGTVKDQAELARWAQVSRARVTQIMDLLMLAPDIQEEILFLSPVTAGRDPVHLRQVRRMTLEPSWQKQRTTWNSRSGRGQD